MSGFDWNGHHVEQERRERRRAAVFSTVTYVVIVVACVFLVAFEVTAAAGRAVRGCWCGGLWQRGGSWRRPGD